MDTDPLYVKTSWAVTSNARGSAVTEYRVKFKGADGIFYTPDVAPNNAHPCIPANLVIGSVGTPPSCSMLMSVLTSAPFSLAAGAPIIARVEAKNAIGYSTASADNTAYATAITAPTVAPTLSRGASTSPSTIHFTWTSVASNPANGGSAVTAYKVYKDTTNEVDLKQTVNAGGTLEYTTSTAITGGVTYNYYVRAVNIYGEGVFSSVF